MTSPANYRQWHPMALLAFGAGAGATARGPAEPRGTSERLPVAEHDGDVRQPGPAEEHRLHEELDHRVQALGG